MINISRVEPISAREIFYFRQRQKNKVFQSVLEYFVSLAEKGQITKKELAEKLGKDPAQITRWFNAPGNWTLDTISDLLLAMGAEMKHEVMSLEDGQIYRKIINFSDDNSTQNKQQTGSSDNLSLMKYG